MRKYLFLLVASVILISGCQPQPVIVNSNDNDRQPQPPVVVERPIIIRDQWRPRPIIIDSGCNHYHHCGRPSCSTCRSHGWAGIGIGIGIGVGPHHHH